MTHNFNPDLLKKTAPQLPIKEAVIISVLFLSLLILISLSLCSTNISITSRGIVTPKNNVLILTSPISSVVSSINKKDGDHVNKGDLLFSFDLEEDKIKKDGIYEQLKYKSPLLDELINLSFNDEYISSPMGIKNSKYVISKINRMNSSIRSINFEILEKKQQIDNSNKMYLGFNRDFEYYRNELAIMSNLFAKGSISKQQYLKYKYNYDKAKLGEEQHRNVINLLKIEYQSLLHKKSDLTESLKLDINTEIKELRDDVISLNTEFRSLKDKTRRENVYSPISGYIEGDTSSINGKYIQAGERLFTIVPDTSDIELAIDVSSRDFGFISLGDNVLIKLDAFPYLRYGFLKGEISHISKNSEKKDSSHYFKIKATVLDNDIKFDENKHLSISSGMTADVEIITGKRKIIDYFISPLIENIDASFKER